MALAALLLGLSLTAEVPVLLDPEGARKDALAAVERLPPTDVAARLRAAETLILARDPRGAQAILAATAPAPDRALAARAEALALNAAVALGDEPGAAAHVAALEPYEGWTTHAGRQAMTMMATSWGRTLGLYGSVVFSLALALAMIGGARELLRPRLPTLILAAIALGAVGATALISPLLANVVALADLAIVALAHASYSTLRRSDPAPRLRVFLAVVVLAGAAGAVLAVVAPLPWAFVLSAL